jgi:SAM-dependent methyltransferase
MLIRNLPEIRAIYDRNADLVKSPTGRPQKRVLELEAKYGHYVDNRFNSNVPYIHYDRLLTLLRALPDIPQETIEESHVAQAGDVRRVTTTNPGDGPETVLWQRKQRLQDFELYDYDVRVSVNVEENLAPAEVPTNFVAQVIRDRTRHHFVLADGLVGVDLTEVLMRDKTTGPEATGFVIRPRYEVEVEFLGTARDLNVFTQQVEYIFRLLRGTNIIYTNEIKARLIADVIKILGGTKPDMIDKDVLVEARNIKRRDLVYGGIVGNQRLDDDKILAQPRRPNGPAAGTNYMITFKADGLRKMFIVHTTGIWLVYPPYEFNLVLDLSSKVPQLDRLLTGFNGTIFDGELVIPKVNKGVIYWYLAFDCLAFRGSAGIQRQPYTERAKIVTALAGAVKTPVITIETKKTRELTNPREFFRLVREFLDERDNLEYDEDGLIFVPIDTYYNPHSERYPLRDRSLARIPDICKWKEGIDITIDFALRWLPGGVLELHVYDEAKNETVPFRGDLINPLTPDMIDQANPLILGQQSGRVVEYEWVPLPARAGVVKDRPRGILQPRRLRLEKSGPNKLEIALDDWEDIMNPISEEDLRGETLDSVFAYHNRVKKSSIEMLTHNPDFNPKVKGSKRYVGANILDIGSGYGGDVAKWKRLADRDDPRTGFVVAVEPNEVNRRQLVQRIGTFSMQDKVLVVPTGGEDTVAITEAVRRYIPGGKVDAVTLMLSLSFFWASTAHLDALIQTIVTNLKPGGKIVFLTIDGDVVEQIFEPALGGPYTNERRISEANLYLYPRPRQVQYGRALDFVLPNTIVGEQREYLVHLQDFSRRLSVYGINLHEIYRAEGEKLLSEESALFSSMYSYGYYVNDDKTALIPAEQTTRTLTNIALPAVPVPIKSPAIKMELTPASPVIPEPQIPVQRVPSPVVTVPVVIPSPRVPLPAPSPKIPVTIAATIPSPKLTQIPVPAPSPRVLVPAPVVPTVQVPTRAVPTVQVPAPLVPTIPTIPVAAIRVPATLDVRKPTKFQIEQNQLRWLAVNYTGRGGRIVDGPARNDDTYAPLTCTWYQNLVRIATIGDGSCFIHAVLKAFYRLYQENNGAAFRLQLAAKMRRDLGVALGLENPLYPGHTYWETSARGAFPRMVMQQINDEALVRDLRVDYSLAGLQRLFNSTSQLGDEVYTFVADALNMDIYVLRATQTDLYPHYHTRRPGILRNGIVIIGNMYHYEVLAINTNTGFQTVFPPDDPFLVALTALFVGDGDFNDIVNTIPYNSDDAFVADFVDAFTDETGLHIPEDIDEIFTAQDPFRLAMTRLMPQIEDAAQQRVIVLNTPDVKIVENPVLDRLNRILRILHEAGFNGERLHEIRDIVEHRLVPDIPQDLNAIVAAAETDGLLTHDEVQAIANVEATL